MKRDLRLTDADHAQIREAVAQLIEARLGDAADLATLRAELIAAKRDRDDWKRQAQALADRNAELREDVRQSSALKPRLSPTEGAAE